MSPAQFLLTEERLCDRCLSPSDTFLNRQNGKYFCLTCVQNTVTQLRDHALLQNSKTDAEATILQPSCRRISWPSVRRRIPEHQIRSLVSAPFNFNKVPKGIIIGLLMMGLLSAYLIILAFCAWIIYVFINN